MTTGPAHTLHQGTCSALSSPALVRLVTEIDDNGTIPLRGLASALPDLTPHQLRQATEQATALELLDRSEDGLGLSAAGLELADLYDTVARWARQHDFPDRACDFTSRIRHTFALLAERAAGDHSTRTVVGHGLDRLHHQFDEWIGNHQPENLGRTWGTAA